jgi:hypothetical protein
MKQERREEKSCQRYASPSVGNGIARAMMEESKNAWFSIEAAHPAFRARACMHRTKFHKLFMLTMRLSAIKGDKESAIQSSICKMVLWYFFG